MYRKIFQNRRNACFRFAPDAEFPAIHGEKGITTFDLVQNVSSHHTDHSEAKLLSFKSGQRYNMVPDHAKAHILVEKI